MIDKVTSGAVESSTELLCILLDPEDIYVVVLVIVFVEETSREDEDDRLGLGLVGLGALGLCDGVGVGV